MNCSQAQDRFPELLDGRLAAADTAAVRAHLAACPDCQREYSSLAQTLAALDQLPAAKPGPRLRTHFYAMLEEEKNSAASLRAAAARQRHAARVALWRWILTPLGAAAVALFAFLAGTRYSAPGAVPAADAATKARIERQEKQLADMQTKLDTVGQLVSYSLLQQRSTSERLQGVLATLDQRNPNQRVLSDLIASLALDPSVNVRLSALDALYPHANQKLVRAGVLASLPREQNPLVQVAMIDFLVAARDHDATPELEKLSRDDTIDRAVRDSAKRALAQL
ncbi:MAG TPA: zf-HC2 domain-containing protein [Opitutus sp.]|nr:zf-HC2 domain-containing protein [Opitutus sp.]